MVIKLFISFVVTELGKCQVNTFFNTYTVQHISQCIIFHNTVEISIHKPFNDFVEMWSQFVTFMNHKNRNLGKNDFHEIPIISSNTIWEINGSRHLPSGNGTPWSG